MSSDKERISRNKPEKSENDHNDLKLSSSGSADMPSASSSDDLLLGPSSAVSSFEKTANEKTSIAAPVSAITGLLFTVVAFLSLASSYLLKIDWTFAVGGIVVMLGVIMIANAGRRKS